MTRKRRDITERDVVRWIGQGFGQGEGIDYRSWMKIRDVPSRGRSTRVAALRVHRTHHLLSDIEYCHFLLADFRTDTVEIREQIALLPREDTQSLARELGIRHPRYPGSRTDTVMTSDLWVNTVRNGQRSPYVLCVKCIADLQPTAKGIRRTIEKLTIERRYWSDLGIQWRIVTEADYDRRVVRNLGLLRPHSRYWRSEAWQLEARRLAAVVLAPANAGHSLAGVVERANVDRQTGLQLFGLAVWKHWIQMDLRQTLRWHAPVPLVRKEGLHA